MLGLRAPALRPSCAVAAFVLAAPSIAGALGTLLAVTIERASGQPLARVAAERSVGPLGMTRTQFRDAHTRIVPGRAAAYAGSAARG
jgi:hypothetical protein